MSSVRPGAVVAIWNGIAEEARDEFCRWHESEHMPERVGIAGFLRGRRYRAVAGAPDYFTRYDLAGPDVMTGEAYQARLNAPTPWTLTMLPHFRDTARALCASVFVAGEGARAWLVTVRIHGEADAATLHALARDLASNPDGLRIDLFETDNSASGRTTKEKASRAPDRQFPDWVLLIETRDRTQAEAMKRLVEEQAATSQAMLDCGIYLLEFDLHALGGTPSSPALHGKSHRQH